MCYKSAIIVKPLTLFIFIFACYFLLCKHKDLKDGFIYNLTRKKLQIIIIILLTLIHEFEKHDTRVAHDNFHSSIN